ncbi:MAG: hypothetical protein DRR42_25315 [Gammaproteobacteria bacterium]|nr:MAG: hypothetical protein DRR42_25315 [Gammaproteobacteria bacterium]
MVGGSNPLVPTNSKKNHPLGGFFMEPAGRWICSLASLHGERTQVHKMRRKEQFETSREVAKPAG